VIAFVDGRIEAAKVPTTPQQPDAAVVEGARQVGVERAPVFNHASTVGLNAVITRRLPKVAFLTTLGHRDILDMGRCWRPLEAMTDPSWRRPFGDATAPLVPRYLRRGIHERITASGDVLIPLDEAQARRELEILKRCGIEGVAICLINSYVTARHEEQLRELAWDVFGGDFPVSISSEVSPLAKEFSRASTTVIDAFMKLIYGRYSNRLGGGLAELGFTGNLNYADCAAQLLAAEYAMEHPYKIVFAGPAAGTVSSAHFGGLLGEDNLICADVGGTSCDISVVDGGKPFVNTTFELEHDLIVNAFSNEISSLGAGGGSIVSISPTGEIQVGPESAGADPGPACYGKGGTRPTVTDAALLMGILDPDGFAGGRMRLQPDLARAAFESLDTTLDIDQRIAYAWNMGLNNVAEGILDIVIKHGADPRDYTLVAYGAAGPMLLPSLRDLVRVKRIVVPPYPGLFSALGLLSSDLVYADNRSAYTILGPEAAGTIDAVFREMEQNLLRQIKADGTAVEIARSFDGRLLGQTWETPFIEIPGGTIDEAAVATMIANFHDVYEQRSGNRFEAIPVQGVTYRVQAVVHAEKVDYPRLESRNGSGTPRAGRTLRLRHLGDGDLEAGEFQRAELLAGDRVAGPAVIREPMSTTLVPAGAAATVGTYGELVIEPATMSEVR
jgi:N-methylhydantoinase A